VGKSFPLCPYVMYFGTTVKAGVASLKCLKIKLQAL
jgi:hypothetical protein